MAKDIDKFFKKKLEGRSFEFKDTYWQDALTQIDQAEKEQTNNNIKKWLLGLLFFTMLSFGFVFSIQKYTAAPQASLSSFHKTNSSSKQDHAPVQTLPEEPASENNRQADKTQLNVLHTNKQDAVGTTITKERKQEDQNILPSTPEAIINNSQNKTGETFEHTESLNTTTNPKPTIATDDETGLSLTYPYMQKEIAQADFEEGEENTDAVNEDLKNNIITKTHHQNHATTENNNDGYAKNLDNNPIGNNNTNTSEKYPTYTIASPENEGTIPPDQIQNSNQPNSVLTESPNSSIFPVSPLPKKEMALEYTQKEEILEVTFEEIPDDPFSFNKKKKHDVGIYASTLIKPKGSDRRDILYGLKVGVFGRFAISKKLGIRTELLYSKKGGNLPYAQSIEAKIYSFGSTLQEQILLPTALHHTELGLHLDYAIHRKHHLGFGINLGYLFVIRGNVARPANEDELAPSEKLSRYLSDYALPGGSTRIDNEGFDSITPNVQLYYAFNFSENWQLHIRSNWRTNHLLQNIQSALDMEFAVTTLPTVEDPIKLNFEIGLGYNLFKF